MTGPEIYVVTRDIKAAAQGRETDILDALNIPWRNARPHIDCPYPEHGTGQSDWRWDDKKKRAFCTCNADNKADTVSDVVAKCEGLGDYEATKIRMAELLGRADLVKTKGGKGGQRQDAESLMNPPADQRDDSLPRAYLAHRLRVEPGAVLMPTTPSTGFRSLGYFDPPLTPGGKPIHVGDFPCCAFGMVGADGRRHAQRIYVAQSGQGKADLGRRDDGKTRDPKKSARVAEGDNTNGRAVLWGNPATADHVILGEGIETCAALALAFQAEVETGAVLVAAGVTANGIEAFDNYGAAKRITLAADRDELAIPSKPQPSRRGERAARNFGLRRHEALDIRIAMPGRPDTKFDWLDVLLADGATAVRAGIEGAARFTPTPGEIAAHAEKLDGEGELARITAECPLPEIYGTHLEYRRFGEDVWAHKSVTVGKGEDKEAIFVPVFTPFGITARLRYIGDDQAYGLRLVVFDMGGALRRLDVERTDLAKLGAAEARSVLFGAGLRTMDDGEKIVVECMKAAKPEREITVVRKPGWHDLDGMDAPVFVCPDGAVLGLPEGLSLELSVGAQLDRSVAQGGTLDGWKSAVAAAVSVPGCPHWTIGTIAAFVGPVIGLTGMDSAGINLSGLSSSGKTTGQRCAASAWSKPTTKGNTLFQTAKATVNSLEQMAARSNGTVLVLDELAHVSGKELGRIIYTLSAGVGKRRMTAAATVRESYTWTTFAVLSAETSLEEKVRKDDGEWTAGQAVRMADIDVTGIDRGVSAATLAKIDGVRTNFGHAGAAFVRALIAQGMHRDPQVIRDGANELARRIAGTEMNGGVPDSALIRAANVFALLTMAGGMAKQFGLLPSDVDIAGAIRWAWARFIKSSDAAALDPEQQAIANMQTWIAERWGITIHDLNAETRPIREAVGWFDDDAVYLPAHRLMEASGGTLKETEVGKALKARECLVRTKSPKHTFVDYVPRVGKLKAYVLSREEFGRGSERTGLKVVNGGRF